MTDVYFGERVAMTIEGQGKNMSNANDYIDDLTKPEPLHCAACGKKHQTPETLKKYKCRFTKREASYCDDVCIKWRYYPLKHNPHRYDEWYFGKDRLEV